MYNRYYVCDDHFAEDSFVLGTRTGLKRNSVPTLAIPALYETAPRSDDSNRDYCPASKYPVIYPCGFYQ
ncbi:hypothetical protein NQ318_008456 [Aromia moschata]|uniref:THAP-type domain-containing protein n=1 Tax=Aromia moschata TaxID=1265417 RepID=A0AAV8Y947_9CUCU|nr:hypothetical protein NQ318_008456 [Aromia moschata]